MKRYASFVLRCWRLETDEHRIEVEHVQSGARTRVQSLAEAMDWIDGNCPSPAVTSTPNTPPTRRSPGQTGKSRRQKPPVR